MPFFGRKRPVVAKTEPMTTTTTVRTHRGYPASMGLAAFFMMLASLFFWLSAFSVPYIKSIHYIHTGENDVKYGNFGWCANDDTLCYRHVGYAWLPQIIDNDRLTGSLILVALTAAFGSIAFFSLLHSITNLRSGFFSVFLTMFTVLLATISFLLVVICFGVAHHRLEDDNLDPKYGAAFVLVIVGWLLYLACVPLEFIGWFRQRHYRDTTTTVRKNRWYQTTDNSEKKGHVKRDVE